MAPPKTRFLKINGVTTMIPVKYSGGDENYEQARSISGELFKKTFQEKGYEGLNSLRNKEGYIDIDAIYGQSGQSYTGQSSVDTGGSERFSPIVNFLKNRSGSSIPSLSDIMPRTTTAFKKAAQGKADPGDILSVLAPGWTATVDDGIPTALRSFAQSGSFGLSEPVAAGMSSLLMKALGDERPLGFMKALGIGDENLTGDIYSDVAAKQKREFAQQQAEHPVQDIGGMLAGFMVPGTAFARTYKGVSKPIAKLLSGGGNLKRTGGLVERIGGGVLSGALSSAIEQGVNPEATVDPSDLALGAAFGGLSEAVVPGAELATRKLGEVLPKTPLVGQYLKTPAEKMAKISNRLKDMMNEARDSIENLSRTDDLGAGLALKQEASNFNKSLNKMWDDTVNPIQKRLANKRIKLTQGGKSIKEILVSKGVKIKSGKKAVASKDPYQPGKVIREAVPENVTYDKSFKGAENKGYIDDVIQIREELKSPKPVRRIKEIIDDISDKANFDKTERSAIEKQYGALSRKMKEWYNDALSKVASPEEREVLDQARNIYAQSKPMVKHLEKVTYAEPQKVAQGFFNRTTGQQAVNMVRQNPALKESMKDAALNHIIKGRPTANTLRQRIKNFGESQLSEILGQDTYNKILQFEKALLEGTPYRARKIAEEMVKNKKPGAIRKIFNKTAPTSTRALSPATSAVTEEVNRR